MDKRKEALDDIFSNDPLGLLNFKVRAKAKTTDQRLIDSFEEINQFFDDNGRLPEDDMANISEMQLHATLDGLKNNLDKIKQLKEYDRHNLLPELAPEDLENGYKLTPPQSKPLVAEPEPEYANPDDISSIDDIFSGDAMGILGGDDAGLFDLKHVKKESDRAETDFVAKRKPCKHFDKYEHLFKQVHRELREGSRKLTDFKVNTLQEGQYYVQNGVVLYLKEIRWDREDHYKEDGTRVRKDGRTTCVFENGTESNMLLRSLEKLLYTNGKAITENSERAREEFLQNFGTANKDDKYGGYIYILKSLSNDRAIKDVKDLYKVGFCSTTVEQRIQDAHKQPTYLMSPVHLVTSWKCFNMDANTFEGLLHKLFGDVCLDVTVTDLEGKNHQPREWFIVPLDVIEQAVELIITGQIVNYRYDKELKQLVLI